MDSGKYGRSLFALPAPVVPPLRDDDRTEGDWRIEKDRVPTSTSRVDALWSTMPRAWDEAAWEKRRNVSETGVVS